MDMIRSGASLGLSGKEYAVFQIQTAENTAAFGEIYISQHIECLSVIGQGFPL